MQLTCPKCATTYDVPDNAIGPNGRKIRCRACEASWHEPPRVAATPPPPLAPQPGAPVTAAPVEIAAPPVAVVAESDAPPPARRKRRGPWLLLALAVLVVALGVAAAVLAFGSRQVASRLGLAQDRVPLGIEITHQPDWRQIPGGSQLFAVSGRIWNPTGEEQPVPDIRAELKDKKGKRVYSWTIARPVARLGPGQQVSFDGAAVDVPAASSNVSVSFAGTEGN
jgi:predicted Zn finger-like uncharacterized protein